MNKYALFILGVLLLATVTVSAQDNPSKQYPNCASCDLDSLIISFVPSDDKKCTLAFQIAEKAVAESPDVYRPDTYRLIAFRYVDFDDMKESSCEVLDIFPIEHLQKGDFPRSAHELVEIWLMEQKGIGQLGDYKAHENGRVFDLIAVDTAKAKLKES